MLNSTAVHQLLNRQVPKVQQHHRQLQQQQQPACVQKLPSRSSGYSSSGADDAAVVDALLKYKFYKQSGIDPQHVAPYREVWLHNALGLVPQAPPPLVSQVCIGTSKSAALAQRRAPVVAVHLHPSACTCTLQQCHSSCTPHDMAQVTWPVLLPVSSSSSFTWASAVSFAGVF
jgi:hypothetical protein